MSYADIVLQRRKELENAFRERYNPAEDVLSTLADIDKEMFRRKGIEAEQERAAAAEKRRAEMFGLEKSREEALAKKYEAEAAQTREDRAALARERDARAAAAREEARRKAEAAALEGGARDIYGRLVSKGQRTKDVLEGTRAQERRSELETKRKEYADKMADAMARGDTAEVARLRSQIDAGTKESLGLKPPSGYTVSDIEEMAEAYGTSYGAMLAEVQRMEAEDEESRLKMGLTGEKSESERALQEERRAAAAKYGRQGWPKPVNPAEEADKAERRRLDLERARLTNEKIKLQTGELGGFRLTPQRLDKVQEARIAAVAARDGINSLRNLIKKYPNFESYTGPLDNAVAWAEQKFGAQSKEAAEIRATILGVFQAYKLIQTGQASGNAEMEMLANIMPKTSDMLPAITGKIDAYDNLVMNQIENWDLMLSTKDIRGADVRAGVKSKTTEPTGADPYAQYSE